MQRTLHICSHQIITTTLQSRKHDYPHFIDEEIEVQEGKVVCLRHIDGKRQSWDFNPRSE